MSRKIKVATTAISVVPDKEKNLQKYLKFIDEAANQGAKLIVFPEESLQGYGMMSVEKEAKAVPEGEDPQTFMMNLMMKARRYQHDNAEVVPEGESTQRLIKKAKEKDIHIIWGMVERDKNAIEVIHNAAVLVGPEGYVGTFRKVHLTFSEEILNTPGKDWPVFTTSIGKIGMLICYDRVFPESARELALGGAEILVHPAAWGKGLFVGPEPKIDYPRLLWDVTGRARAMENQLWLVSSNHADASTESEQDKPGHLGHARIINPVGAILADTGDKEGMVVAEIDLDEIIEYRSVFLPACNLYAQRKPYTYKRIGTIRSRAEIYDDKD